MADPIIAAHEGAPRLFVLSGPGPISIRDQFIRAKLLVDRLDQVNRLPRYPTAEYGVVVVGGGGSGVSAALHAAGKGVRTLLVEREKALFAVQRAGFTRRVCGTQYNWPLDDFDVGVFPGPFEQELPLAVVSNGAEGPPTGRKLATDWVEAYTARHLPSLSLVVRYGIPAVRVLANNAQNCLDVVFKGGSHVTADLVIWAAGFGPEKINSGGYAGIPFWGEDGYERLGSNPNSGSLNILIAGAGDGALQDLLRILTGQSLVRQILTIFNVPDQCRTAIASGEERLWRARAWQTGSALLPYLEEVEDLYREIVPVALVDPNCIGSMQAFFASRRVIYVTLAARESALTPVYGLNRFLTLLIKQFLDDYPQYGSIVHRKGLDLESVSLGPPYTATFSQGETIPGLDEVVVRFGLYGNPPKYVQGLTDSDAPCEVVSAPLRWHSLPTHLPRSSSPLATSPPGFLSS